MEFVPHIKLRRRGRTLCSVAICAALLFTRGVTSAQDFDIDWFATASGGISSGGDFELEGAIGDPDAGDLSGGDFAIVGGFWSIVAVFETPGAPSLRVRLAGNEIVISWPQNGSQGFSLEETPALANPSWSGVNAVPQASNGTNTVSLPLPSGNRFYRLSNP